jgi:hypothetical protein
MALGLAVERPHHGFRGHDRFVDCAITPIGDRFGIVDAEGELPAGVASIGRNRDVATLDACFELGNVHF